MSGNDFKIGSEKKEKKLSWSIVFAWLYLHTFGKILPKKWNKWAENIVEPYEVTNSDDITESGGDKDITLDSELQTKIKAEAINSDEIRQPGDGQSFSLDPQLQTETDVEITNSDNPEGGEVKIGDSRDSGINDDEDELRYEDDFNIQLLLKRFKQSQLNEEYHQQIIQELEEEVAQLEIELEILKEAFSDAAQEVVALREENEQVKKIIELLREENKQLKHDPTEINALNTRNTTEATPKKPNTP
ncbi:MAG TPA: hypothetical protein DEQ74_02070, partial [Wolbachia sp.]|nr:hypothetical protein [Wolbachia sp.]